MGLPEHAELFEVPFWMLLEGGGGARFLTGRTKWIGSGSVVDQYGPFRSTSGPPLHRSTSIHFAPLQCPAPSRRATQLLRAMVVLATLPPTYLPLWWLAAGRLPSTYLPQTRHCYTTLPPGCPKSCIYTSVGFRQIFRDCYILCYNRQ